MLVEPRTKNALEYYGIAQRVGVSGLSAAIVVKVRET